MKKYKYVIYKSLPRINYVGQRMFHFLISDSGNDRIDNVYNMIISPISID